MRAKIRDTLFFLCVISVIFSATPVAINTKFFGGPFFRQLVIYPLIASILYTIYCQIKYKEILKSKEIFGKYILIYLLILLGSLILGLINYPYYEQILYGPANQIERLPKVIDFLGSLGIYVEKEFLVRIWMFLRPLKGIILEILYTFGGVFIFYNWYTKDRERGICILKRGVIASVIICLCYCIIEFPQLCGSKTATTILTAINPYIHSVKVSNNWWPPLLWKGQMRSVFAEPSYFGIYAAYAMPVLWLTFFSCRTRVHKFLSLCVITLLAFCIFMTQARTAVLLMLGESFLLLATVFFIRSKEYIRDVIITITCCGLVFFGATYCISHYVIASKNLTANTEMIKETNNNNKKPDKSKMNKPKESSKKSMSPQKGKGAEQINKEKDTALKTYFANNIASAVSSQKRSNVSRFSMIKTNIKMGMDHPILGVGYSLRTAYIPKYMPEEGTRTVEMHGFLTGLKKNGIMKTSIPMLSEFTGKFSEIGFVGLFWYLIPPMYLMYLLIKNIFEHKSDPTKQIQYACVLIALIGLFISGIFETINNGYTYWIIMGIGYAICLGKEKEEL